MSWNMQQNINRMVTSGQTQQKKSNNMLGAILGGGASLIGNAISGLFNRGAQKRANAENRRMAEYEWSKNLEMWNKSNEYNRPEAQMERLKSAGLNPNMVYGSGTASGNTSGQMPKYNAPTIKPNPQPDFTGVLGDTTNTLVRNAQTKNIMSATELNNIKGTNEIIKGAILGSEAKKKGVEANVLANTQSYQESIMQEKARQEKQKVTNLEQTELEIKSRTDLNKANKLFSDYRNELNSMGIHTTDALPFRIAYKLYKEGKDKINGVKQTFMQTLKKVRDGMSNMEDPADWLDNFKN